MRDDAYRANGDGSLAGRRARWASALRSWGIRLTHLHCRVELGPGVYLGPGFSLDIPGPGTFVAGRGARFERHFHCEIAGGGRVLIGAGTAFSSLGLIHCATVIEIGERCSVGEGTLFVDGQHRYEDLERSFLAQGYRWSTVRVGDRVRIGDRCTVMASIGEGTSIASGSAVTRDIPAYCLARGAPAKVVDYFGPPERRPASV